MPTLPNPRHEKFCIALFEGQPQNAAYEAAGYRYHEGNASRLRSNEKVIARLAELQSAVAKKSEVTVQSLLDELEYARSRADSLDQLSAAVKATSEKAKISGLLIQRVEVGTPDEFNLDGASDETIAEKVIKEMAGEKVFPEDELDKAKAVTVEWLAYMEEFIARGRFPWVVEGNSPADIRDREINHKHRRLTHGHGDQRRPTHGNGSGQKNRAP